MTAIHTSLTGLVAAPFTPFYPDGSINFARIPEVVAHLRATGVAGAFVCGTTGEGASLTFAERCEVAQTWRQAAGNGLRVIVHVGCNSLEESKALARHAASIGADAFATLAPNFFRPEGISGLVDWCASLAAAAPELPFYYYHMPAMTGVGGNMTDFLPRATEQIPNFAGIKFTHENLMDYTLTVAAAGGRQDILFGRDEILLSALVAGAQGGVGSTYNYIAPIFQRVITAFKAGDLAEARAQQLLATRIIDVMARHGGLSAGKAIMGLIGLDCGPMRAPLKTLSSDAIAALRAELEQTGFFAGNLLLFSDQTKQEIRNERQGA